MSSNVTLFSGLYRHSLDEKCRVTIPTKWRQIITKDLRVLKHSRLPNLQVLVEDEFQTRLEAVESLNGISAAEKEAYNRGFFSRAVDCPIDKQGRLQLPAELVRSAGLKGELVLVGIGRRMEIWSSKDWEVETRAEQSTYERLAALIGG